MVDGNMVGGCHYSQFFRKSRKKIWSSKVTFDDLEKRAKTKPNGNGKRERKPHSDRAVKEFGEREKSVGGESES